MTENNNNSNHSAHESDAILFWLEQEPVESPIDIYLPADTPIHRPSNKILYQINKKRELKKARAIERLKAHHYEGITEARRRFAKEVRKSKWTSKECEQYLENIKSADFLSEHTEEMLNLIKEINTLTEGESNSSTSNALLQSIAKDREAYQQLQQEKIKAYEEKETKGEDVIHDLFNEELNNYRTQYYRMASLIQQKKENEQLRQQQQQQQSPIETAPQPPLPPRVSRNDPSERVFKEYPPSATH